MAVVIKSNSADKNPRIVFRDITGKFNPSGDDDKMLESVSYFQCTDLVSEGPIEGFCDATGGLVSGQNILQGIYYDDVPIRTTSDGLAGEQYNFRNASVVAKYGTSGQSGFYTGQGTTNNVNLDNLYWLEDFSFAAKTISKNITLHSSRELEGQLTDPLKGSHTVLDSDVDWLGLTIGVGSCYYIRDDGLKTGNNGRIHICGDFTGVSHKSRDKDEIIEVIADSPDEYNLYLDIEGLATSPYREDIFLKLREDVNRSRKIYIRNVTDNQENFRSVFDVEFGAVTEIVRDNFRYPHSAIIGSSFSAENFGRIPTRTFDLKLKKVKVPSNYFEKKVGPNGPTNIREDGTVYNPVNPEDGTDRHEGVWDGNFKDDLEWTDNPAWILYDLITNDRYGLGEYIKETKVDKFQLYKIAKYCDKIVPTSRLKKGATNTTEDRFVKERKYSCNIMLQSKTEAYKAINEIASIFQGIATFSSDKIFISQDSVKDPVLRFNNSNVVDGFFEYQGASKQARYTAVKIAYKDANDNFIPKYEYIEDPEGIIRYGLILKDYAAIGCTSKDQALRLGRWALKTSNLEEEFVTFQTNLQAEYLHPGHVIRISDSLKSSYRNGGRVKKIVNNKANVSENYILLDQQLNTGDYNFSDICFTIPREDSDSDTDQFRKFVHRNDQFYNAIDPGNSRSEIIPIDSRTSNNPSLHNYIENTPEGAKILTHEFEDMILSTGTEYDYVDDTVGLGVKTFNDYFLSSGVLKNLTINGTERSRNTEKIITGSAFFLNGSGDFSNSKQFSEKDFRVVSIQEGDDGIYSISALEYDRDKFDDVENLSTVYKESTFELTPTNQPQDPGGPKANVTRPGGPETVPSITAYGFPVENSVNLTIRPTGFVNSQGETKSKVEYFFHNTEENSKYYGPLQSNEAYYKIRVQEISDDYFDTLQNSTVNSPALNTPILQNGKYVISGIQECGDYFQLYDSAGEEADLGGSANRPLSVTNYLGNSFSEDFTTTRRRVMSETGKMPFSGCNVHGSKSSSLITGDILSGTFVLDNPSAYYELRWSENNKYGSSPEKVIFFRASRDEIPPAPCSDFEAKIIFDNIHFNWTNPSDSDFSHSRIYTGFKEDTPRPSEDGFLVKSDSNFALYPLDKYSEGRDVLANSFRDGKFHIRPVDLAGNTGEALNSNQLSIIQFGTTALTLSTEIRTLKDGTQNSYIIANYSNNTFNGNVDFKEYRLQVQDTANQLRIDYSLPKYDGSSGRFEYLAKGGHTYKFEIRAVDVYGNEEDIRSAEITAEADTSPPGKATWIDSEKNGSNVYLSWNNPSDSDLDRVLLYTGSRNLTGESEGTYIHQESKFRSEVIPLFNFDGDKWYNLYFWLRGVDTSNNTGDFSIGNTDSVTFPGGPYNEAFAYNKNSQIVPHNSGQKIVLSIVNPPSSSDITLESGIYNDVNGDGSSYAYINYKIEEPLDINTTSYKVDLSRFSNFNPLAGSQTSLVDYGIATMTGSGSFNNLLANERYYLRFRTFQKDGRFSAYSSTEIVDTPKDETLPENPNNFYITSGPKQVFLEWDWGNGISSDIDSILVYKTGIPTGRINEVSLPYSNKAWSIQDLTEYFEENPEEYTYKLNPGTSFIDNDIETGIFSGYGIESSNWHQEPKHPVFYHYFLKTVDRSNNTGVGLVVPQSTSVHSDPMHQRQGILSEDYPGGVGNPWFPHYLGFVTGGGIDDSYLENIRAGKILTDRITSNTFILANPSGRIVSDEVYAENSSNQRMAYSKGGGLYVDHKMFRIGDPDGGQGLFWTGEYDDVTRTFETPSWDSDGNLNLDPNILEIRGNMTAGSITIGSNSETQFRVDSEGELSIGNQSHNITGFFTGGAGTKDVDGTEVPVQVQLSLEEYKNDAFLLNKIADASDGFLQISYPGGLVETRGIQQINSDNLRDYDDSTDPFGLVILNNPVVSETWNPGQTAYNNRPTWRLIDVKFLVTNDGTLYAQDASIAGTVTANNFEARKTIILGDEGDITNNLSIMQSYGFTETNDCNTVPAGWRIRGDGSATFKNLEIVSGSISGVSLAVGKCGGPNFFKADSDGNISIGPSNIYNDENNDFHVSNEGKLYAVDAVVSGTISGSAGRIGGLEMTENRLATIGRTNINYNAFSNNSPGLWLEKDGNFSIANDQGDIIKYNGGDYIDITGLKSSFNDSEVDGRGQGFYIRGGDSRETSYISNFYTDSSSASGIAAKIDTQICGEIAMPQNNALHTIIYKSDINYTIISGPAATDGGEFVGASSTPSNPDLYKDAAKIITYPHTLEAGTSLKIQMPADTKGASSYNFNIGLRRTS